MLHSIVLFQHEPYLHHLCTDLKTKDTIDVTMRDQYGWQPLDIAALNGYEPLSRNLLERKADVNATCEQGMTPLHLAAKRGQTRMVALLLDEQADPELRDEQGRSCVHVAADAKTLEALVSKGVRLDMPDNMGRTPLVSAIYSKESLELMEKLLAVRGDVEERDRLGRTPLAHAVQLKKPGVVTWLLEQKADPSIPDHEGRTPEHRCQMLMKGDFPDVETREIAKLLRGPGE